MRSDFEKTEAEKFEGGDGFVVSDFNDLMFAGSRADQSSIFSGKVLSLWRKSYIPFRR
jgi:hypothetical protein